MRVLLLTMAALCSCVGAVPLPMFFPFGPDYGDTELARGNDVSASVDLTESIPFLGLQRETVIVSTLHEAVCVPVGGWRHFVRPGSRYGVKACIASVTQVVYGHTQPM